MLTSCDQIQLESKPRPTGLCFLYLAPFLLPQDHLPCLALPCLPSLPACLSLPSTHTLPHQTGGGCQDTRRGHQGIGDYGTGRLCRISCTPSLGFNKGMRSKERLHLSQTDTWEHFTALSVPQSCSSVLSCPAAVPVLSALVIMG